MTGFKKYILYIIYTVIIAGFLLFYMFPAETVKNYISYQAGRINPDTRITISSISPALPPGINIKGVNLLFKNEPAFSINRIKAMPDIFSLFGSNKKINFKAETYGGIITGNTSFIKGEKSDQVMVNLNLAGLKINDDIPLLQKQEDLAITGSIDGKIKYDIDKNKNTSASARLIISECIIQMTVPIIESLDLKFQNIEIDATLNKSIIQIQKCVINGNELNGTATGTIRLKQPAGKSILNLTVNLKAHHNFIANLGGGIAAGFLAGKDTFSIRIKGTIENPIPQII